MITADGDLQAKCFPLKTASLYVASPKHSMSGTALKRDTPLLKLIASTFFFKHNLS